MDVSENHTARASKDRTSLFDGWCDRISAATGRTLRQWLDSGTEPARAMAASMVPAPVVHGDEWPEDDAIPDLDDFDAPPSAESAPRSMREEINEAVLLVEKKPTIAEWLGQLETTLKGCSSREEVERELLSEPVCRAGRTFQGAA